ncbi:asparagine synthase C-terminal domain-containing protein [Nitrosopumilus sp.]|uniref:asparagine synthase-related protein n=1 Tax=Nitrosopumilus sp. TaxID=2024843 RepID=UPI00247EA1B7|nr:asparagine synthase C-terminal domain-containing protein [Nitrosopumilus sp.]MCV0430364.1 asparagine synthase C-terminal domain-containing protein [Nitrosopumilus sp.]
MIKEILSLRYYPSLKIPNKKLSSDDFEVIEYQNPVHKIEELIINSIKNSVTEEKISVALSGGVDSTLVLALLRKALPEIQIEAISVKFADSVDETKIATKIAEKFSANHNIVSIDNFLEELPKAISIIKMPFWDTHWYHMVKTAKQFSKSLVSGDGGDELFGGYTFRYEKFLSNYDVKMTSIEKTKLYLDCHERDWVPDQEELFGKNLNFSWDEIYAKLLPYFENSLPPLDQVFLADINGKLLYNWIPLNSKFYSYFELNAVTPLLSKELLKFAPHLKNSLKYNQENNIGKIPLRTILEKHIDPNLITPKKQGFSVNTINLWKSFGSKLCTHYLDNARILQDNLISSEWVKKHLSNLNSEPNVRYVNKFLGLLALEIWYRIFITKEMNENTTLSL